jgi:hypothetical protein
MSGDRKLVREAVAAYFGGSLVTADAGICYQGGPLVAAGLGTAYPYRIKKAAPDQYYTAGMPEGTGYGSVLTVSLGPERITRIGMGGKTSGWRQRQYMTVCDIEMLTYEPHLETGEQALDNLVDALLDLIYADRALGTTSTAYPNGRLITQAGEGAAGIDVGPMGEFAVADRGRGKGGISVTFDCDTYVTA